MKYGKVTLDQIEALLKKVGGEDGLQKLLSGELVVVPADDAEKPTKSPHPNLLFSDGYFSPVEITERFDPRAYYQLGSGLNVLGDFRDWIIAAAQPTEADKTFSEIRRYKLNRDATGEILQLAHPEAVWNATDFCSWLAAKLDMQANGRDGELLNTGWVNLFLVRGIRGVFVVSVRWSSIRRSWNIGTWPLGDEWDAGNMFASKPTDRTLIL